MPSLTSEVRTVPGTVAGYQSWVSKPRVATMLAGCGTLAASCNSQPEARRMGRDRGIRAPPGVWASKDDIDTKTRNKRALSRLCKVGPSLLEIRLPAKAFALN